MNPKTELDSKFNCNCLFSYGPFIGINQNNSGTKYPVIDFENERLQINR